MTSLTTVPDKSFTKDLEIFGDLIKRKENFAFSRFSDGEIYMLNKMEIIMSDGFIKVGGHESHESCAKDDTKHYNPIEHEFYRQKLEEALIHRQENYYLGLSCRCCIGGGGAEGQRYFDWQLNKIGEGNEHNLTWSNLLINSNYLDYINNIVPLFKDRNVIMVVNENADLSKLPFKPLGRFTVGENCMVNDYAVIEEIKDLILKYNVENHVFLIAASFLTNMIIHQVYKDHPNNTYIDIGSSLNPFMPGIDSRRSYMNQLNYGKQGSPCIW